MSHYESSDNSVYEPSAEIEGERITDAIGQTADRLRGEHGADIVIVPYLLAFEGAHSISAHMAADRNVIYTDNEPVITL